MTRRREISSFDTLAEKISFPSRHVPARWRGDRIEAISFLVLFSVTTVCFAKLLTGSNDDDNHALRFQGTSGPFAVAVFAPPGNLAAGTSPFSVLAQDRNTHEPLLDAVVNLTAHPIDDSQGAASTAQANHENSENKLLQAADLNLLTEGEWNLDITLQRGPDTQKLLLPLRVVKPEAGIEDRWPYFVIAVFCLILLIAYFWRHRASVVLHFGRPISSP